MTWKAIYSDGTEIRETDTMPGMTREVLHDGLPTGRTEPQPASPVLLDTNKLRQFIIYAGDTPIHVTALTPGEKILFTRRTKMNLLTGERRGFFYVVGKKKVNGDIETYTVHPDGTVEREAECSIDLSSQIHL